MILLLLITFIGLGLFHLLGYVKGSSRYELRVLKNIHDSIKYHVRDALVNTSTGKTTPDCSYLFKKYTEWKQSFGRIMDTYTLSNSQSSYVSGMNDVVTRIMEVFCPDRIKDCPVLTYDDVVCDPSQFETYFKNIETQNKTALEDVEIQDNYKRDVQYEYPCSINVYKDFSTNGYLYRLKNKKQPDGTCKQVVSSHIEQDRYPSFQ